MKDYRLSEIKNHDRNKDWEVCDDELLSPLEIARLRDIHDDILYTNIEPRDMIELPCKSHFVYEHDDGHITENWRVFYREEFALIGTAVFPTEPEADAFLEELKNKAKEKDDRELAELYDVTDTFNRLAGKKRAGGKLTDAEVDEMLASYNRMCEIEKKRGIRK